MALSTTYVIFSIIFLSDTNFIFLKAVRRLSCMAKSTNNYLVAHVLETENCTFNCRPDGVNIYSATVVFDREGIVVARYEIYNNVKTQREDNNFILLSLSLLCVCLHGVRKGPLANRDSCRIDQWSFSREHSFSGKFYDSWRSDGKVISQKLPLVTSAQESQNTNHTNKFCSTLLIF
jgi:hypothetical protein